MDMKEKENAIFDEIVAATNAANYGVTDEQFNKIKDFCDKNEIDIGSYFMQLDHLKSLGDIISNFKDKEQLKEENYESPSLSKEELLAIKYENCLKELDKRITELQPKDNVFLVQLTKTDYNNGNEIAESSELYYQIYKLMILNAAGFIDCDVYTDMTLKIKISGNCVSEIYIIFKRQLNINTKEIAIYKRNKKSKKPNIKNLVDKETLEKFKLIIGGDNFNCNYGNDYSVIYADMLDIHNAFKESLTNFAIMNMCSNNA